MGEKATEIVNSIKECLSDGPKSISEISKVLEINWRTAEQYLELLKNLGLVMEAEVKNTRTFFYKDKDNYFELPVKDKHKKIISTIYALIRKFCNQFYKKDPTKTQAYKIIWKVNKEKGLNLPIGWYMYGPCCVQVFKNEEKEESTLDAQTVSLVKETTKQYCECDNFILQNKIYDEANDMLYKTKGLLLKNKFSTNEEINPILMDLIKFAPPETVEVVTDFARATLLLGFDKTKTCFEELLEYVCLIRFRDSLSEYYSGYINLYLQNKIETAKKEAQSTITDLVRCNIKSK